MNEQIKVSDVKLFQGFDGTLQLSILIDGEFTERAKKAVESARERLTERKDVGIVIDRLKKQRSLDSNAYFHVLCDKIATVLHITMEEVKVEQVITYGTPLYSVTIPENADIGAFWKYSRWIGNANGEDTYLLYKQTHTLDSKEMSRLIEGTIQAAQALGIETATPKEIEQMQKKWEEEYGKRN